MFDKAYWERKCLESKGREPYKHCFRDRPDAKQHSKQSWHEEIR